MTDERAPSVRLAELTANDLATIQLAIDDWIAIGDAPHVIRRAFLAGKRAALAIAPDEQINAAGGLPVRAALSGTDGEYVGCVPSPPAAPNAAPAGEPERRLWLDHPAPPQDGEVAAPKHRPDCGILEPYPFHGECDCGVAKAEATAPEPEPDVAALINKLGRFAKIERRQRNEHVAEVYEQAAAALARLSAPVPRQSCPHCHHYLPTAAPVLIREKK